MKKEYYAPECQILQIESGPLLLETSRIEFDPNAQGQLDAPPISLFLWEEYFGY